MRVLLVEDEPDLGRAIKQVLIQNAYIIDWVQDGTEAWSYLNDSQITYTLGIFDWLLPGMSGIELLQNLRKQGNKLPVLMLTAKDSLDDRVQGLDAGADDYLVKPFGMKELLARLRALQRRSPDLKPQNFIVGNFVLDYANNQINLKNNKQRINLTLKEFQLLEYFMRHPKQILSRDQILSQLWEWNTDPISNVVAAQVRLLRRKLAVYNAENTIETIYGLGYRFTPDLL
ncbi:MAG: two-component system response regulator RppA [Limnothrix sp.]